MKTTLGTCGNCGGPVQVPVVWWGTVPPTPRCGHCGAEPAQGFGPVMPMKSPREAGRPQSAQEGR